MTLVAVHETKLQLRAAGDGLACKSITLLSVILLSRAAVQRKVQAQIKVFLKPTGKMVRGRKVNKDGNLTVRSGF